MDDTCKLELTDLQRKIIRLFFIKAGSSLTENSVAKHLGVARQSVSKALPFLKEKQVLIIEKDEESKRLSIMLNRDDHKVIWMKRCDNVLQIYESGLVQFFHDHFPEATIILFGSYSYGEDTLKSDIDIAIIGSLQKDVDLSKYEQLLERQININYYKSFKLIHANLLNNILNGITIKGVIAL